MTLEDLSEAIDEERPRAFFEHIRNKDYGLSPEIPAGQAHPQPVPPFHRPRRGAVDQLRCAPAGLQGGIRRDARHADHSPVADPVEGPAQAAQGLRAMTRLTDAVLDTCRCDPVATVCPGPELRPGPGQGAGQGPPERAAPLARRAAAAALGQSPRGAAAGPAGPGLLGQGRRHPPRARRPRPAATCASTASGSGCRGAPPRLSRRYRRGCRRPASSGCSTAAITKGWSATHWTACARPASCRRAWRSWLAFEATLPGSSIGALKVLSAHLPRRAEDAPARTPEPARANTGNCTSTTSRPSPLRGPPGALGRPAASQPPPVGALVRDPGQPQWLRDLLLASLLAREFERLTQRLAGCPPLPFSRHWM